MLISSNCFKIPGSSSIVSCYSLTVTVIISKISCNVCWYSLIFFLYWYSQWIYCFNSSRLKLMLIFLADLLFYCYYISIVIRDINTISQEMSTRFLVDIPFNLVDIPRDNLLISLLTLLISLLISQGNIKITILTLFISLGILCWYPLYPPGYCVDIP